MTSAKRTKSRALNVPNVPAPVPAPVPAQAVPATDSSRLRWKHRVALTAITLLVLLPFLAKPLNVDDPLFVWSAQHIHSNPWNFYGFDVNWFGYSAPMSDMMTNPPLTSYYFAFTGLLLGFSEVGLHLAGLVPAVAAVLGTYELARPFCGRPLLAALLAMATPVFVLCGTSLMGDMLLLALWCWSLALWHRGLLENRHGLLLSGAALAALATLTKFFGVSIVPLLLLAALETERRLSRKVLWLLLPLGVIIAYHYLTQALYGYGHLSTAGFYVTAAANRISVWEEGFRVLVFLGGCVVGLLALAPRFWNLTALGVSAALAFVASLSVIILGWADINGQIASLESVAGCSLLAHVFVFLCAALVVIGLVLSEISRGLATSFMLLAWVVGTLAFAGFINWTLNGRSILPLVPALGILAARRLDQLDVLPAEWRILGEIAWKDLPALALGFALALFAAAGDYAHATSARSAATIIAREFVRPERRLIFVGHWGFQYYLQKLGGIPLDSSNVDFVRGDLIAVPAFNANNIAMPAQHAADLYRFKIEMPLPIATLRKSENAGFYAARFIGRLPWHIGPVPPDEYLIQTVHEPFQLRIKPTDVH